MKDIENQNKIDELQQKVNAENALGPGVIKQNEIQAELNNQQINLNAKAEEEKKAILNQNDAMQIDEADVQKDGPVLQKKDDIPEKPAIIEDPAERMKMLENILIQTQAQIRELNEQNKKMSQILLASMENKKKEEKEKEEREETAKAQQEKEKKKEQEKKKKPRLKADEIAELLESRIEKHIQRANKAAKGKYDGKVMLNGMQPKYYYAAVRDFHKDMKEKIGRIQDPKKREQYFAQYYTQKRMMAYVRHRAMDPVYCRMVDKLKSDKVMEAYQKARYERSAKGIKNMKPLGRGYSADGEIGRIHAIETDRPLFMSEKNQNEEWKQFQEAVKTYNQTVADLAQNGDPSGQAAIEAASTLHNAAFRYKQNTIMDKSQLEYHKEVNAMTEYVSDIINGGLVYANLRQDYRCVIEDAAKDKNAKADYSDPAAAADLILAQTMMGKTPRATKYWEDFPDNDTALQKKDEILKSVQKNRELIVTDPMFNTILLDKQQTSLGDFAKNYEKNAAREADKLKKQAEKSRKEKEKETKRQQKEAEKKRKAEEAKKKKEDASKKKEQKIQKKPA